VTRDHKEIREIRATLALRDNQVSLDKRALLEIKELKDLKVLLGKQEILVMLVILGRQESLVSRVLRV